jgi:hypothetical protein
MSKHFLHKKKSAKSKTVASVRLTGGFFWRHQAFPDCVIRLYFPAFELLIKTALSRHLMR